MTLCNFAYLVQPAKRKARYNYTGAAEKPADPPNRWIATRVSFSYVVDSGISRQVFLANLVLSGQP